MNKGDASWVTAKKEMYLEELPTSDENPVPPYTHWPMSGSVVKNPPANAGEEGPIPGWGRAPGKGNGNPLQYSCLGNPMNRGTWRGYSPWGRKRVGPNLATKHHPLNHTSTHCQGVDLQ